METRWLKEALFAGMTTNAFKLGTVLTLGWFWPRVLGCSVLYRGPSMEQIDFSNILSVAEQYANQIQPPSYVQHNSNTTYFYVIRRANNLGYQEHTLAAAVKVSIDADGGLAQPQPNNIFDAKAERLAGSKVQLVWYYCPIEQQSAPADFKIYFDSGTGQIDYGNPIASISYAGRRFYSYQSDALNTGRYLFAIRTADAVGTEDASSAQIGIQLQTKNPDAISLMSAETV